MAVFTTSFLAAIESDCRRPVTPSVASGRHLGIDCVLDAQHRAEWIPDPTLGKAYSLTTSVRWIGEHDVIIERTQCVSERESGLTVNRRLRLRAQRRDILLERAKASRILFDEVC